MARGGGRRRIGSTSRLRMLVPPRPSYLLRTSYIPYISTRSLAGPLQSVGSILISVSSFEACLSESQTLMFSWYAASTIKDATMRTHHPRRSPPHLFQCACSRDTYVCPVLSPFERKDIFHPSSHQPSSKTKPLFTVKNQPSPSAHSTSHLTSYIKSTRIFYPKPQL